MSAEPITQPHIPPLAPDGRPETWVFLRDLPMPADARREFEEACRAYPYPRKQRLWLEDDLKLCYLFPAQWLATKRTERSLIVLMAGDIDSPEFMRFRDSLSPEERRQVLIEFNADPHAQPVTVI